MIAVKVVMAEPLRHRLFRLFFESDLAAIRCTLALGAIFIGLGFLWPVATFPTADQIEHGTGRSRRG